MCNIYKELVNFSSIFSLVRSIRQIFVWKLLGTHARAWGSLGLDPRHQQAWPWWNEWVIKFKDLFQTADSEVCVIHISCVIMTYTLELLSSLTKITHHLQVTKTNKKQHKLEQLERLRSEDTPRRLMITHTIESYWIPSQKKTKSKLQI